MVNQAQGEIRISYLNPEFLEEVRQSCGLKLSESEYDYVIERIEGAVETVIRSMSNAYDRGYGFLKLAIHSGSTPESMAIVYEKLISQTPWKYKRTVLSFVEAIDTIFRFASKNEQIIEKIQMNSQASNNNEKLLEAISELTINYIVKLIEQEKTYLAS